MERKASQIDSAFFAMVAQEHVQLRAFVRSIGVNPEWVDDIAQETLMVALREGDAFDRQADVGKWLRGIARNLVRNEMRKEARRKRIIDQALTELLVGADDQQQEAQREAWMDAHLPALRDCVENLPPKSREIVTNRYAGGWLAPDLAEHFGMTAESVRQALVRIRRQLKACIETRVSEA